MKSVSTAQHSVVGSFETRAQAQRAIAELRRAGFRDDQIGIVSRNTARHDPDAISNIGLADNLDESANWEERAGRGAMVGAAIGAGLGLVVAAALIPAIGPVIAGDTLATLIAGTGAGATAGGIFGGFVGLGISDLDAQFSEKELNAGHTIVTVAARGRCTEAIEILHRYNAIVEHEEMAAEAASKVAPH